MKRNSFLQFCRATGAVMMSPVHALTKPIKKFLHDKGFMVASGKDRNDKSISLLEGDIFDCKVSTSDTKATSMFSNQHASRKAGPLITMQNDGSRARPIQRRTWIQARGSADKGI
ncbi:hypothetical protein [Chryseolinea lacunae]|uniref:Uncharacterized protein n=1 Tax=Chryseolinea lacunae TaxID=2801331 RepID=A0ABS1KMA2_9BACT|nr:hypothetical protein [Chryseolinea lacunae]MBL0740590.1 hypothetical protein [Chryseolinea lacunae]